MSTRTESSTENEQNRYGSAQMPTTPQSCKNVLEQHVSTRNESLTSKLDTRPSIHSPTFLGARTSESDMVGSAYKRPCTQLEKHVVENIEVQDEEEMMDNNVGDSEIDGTCVQIIAEPSLVAAGAAHAAGAAQEVHAEQSTTQIATAFVNRPFARSSYTIMTKEEYGAVEHDDIPTLSETTRQIRALYRRLTNPAI